MNQITDIEKLKGKTVKAYLQNEWDDKLVLTFEDGTFFYMYGCGDTIYFDDKIDADDFDIESVFDLGIVTKEEYQDTLKELEQVRLQAEEVKKEARRRQYEELKKEFEPS